MDFSNDIDNEIYNALCLQISKIEGDTNYGISGDEAIEHDPVNPINTLGYGPDPEYLIATNTHYVPAPVDAYMFLNLSLPPLVINLGEDFVLDGQKKGKKETKSKNKWRRFLDLFKCCFGM